MSGQTCTPRLLHPVEPRRLACAVCKLESGTVVVPLQTRRPVGITLRKVGDSYRCQFCHAPVEAQEEERSADQPA